VRTDDPARSEEIDCLPICDVLVIHDRKLVVFCDFNSLIAYSAEGVAWRSGRVAWDDVKIVAADGDDLRVSGFDPTGRKGGSHPTFTVALQTGESLDKPYPDEPPEGPLPSNASAA
jgi:hypothetical protein